MTQHKSSRDAVTRPRLADHNAKIDSPPARMIPKVVSGFRTRSCAEKREAERRKAHPTNSAQHRQTLPLADARARRRAMQTSVRSLRTYLLSGRARLPALRRGSRQDFTSWRSSRPCLLGSVRADILPALSGSQSSGSTPRLGRSTEENDAQSRSGAGCEPARKHRTRSTLQIASGMRPSMSEILRMYPI